MKKLSLLLTTYLFALDINTYFLSLKENYKEYENSKVIDRDYSSFSDLYGLGITIKDDYFKANLEYVSGNAIYDGATQSGTKLILKETNVYVINTLLSIGKILSIDLGYRVWNRGTSNYEGDYNEKYYWSYIGGSLNYSFRFNNFNISPLISYQKAINPKLKVYIKNAPLISLGSTSGYKFEIPLYVDFENFRIFAFYRYQYWHINKSKTYSFTLGNTTYYIYEPESKTRNQYIGVGLNFSF